MIMKIFNVFLFLSFLFLISCDKTENNVDTSTLRTVTIKDLAADPTTGFDPNNGMPIGDTKRFTFFRFSDSSIVANTDNATTKWDIGFRASTIIVNSGISGPGSAAAYVQTGLFSELKEIPTDSIFKTDVSASNLAVGKSWYTYNGQTMIFSPTPGKTLVVKCSDGKYAKIELLSYYKGSPVAPDAFKDQARYYTFRYVYQSNGSKKFE